MAKHDRPKSSNERTPGGPRGGKSARRSKAEPPKDGQRWTPGRFGKPGKFTGMMAGTFARMREGHDVVAIGAPGTSVTVRLYVEALESFESQKRKPRNLVVIVTRAQETDDFEAYQIPFDKVEHMIPKAKLVNSERAYYTFNLKWRCLSVPDGTRVEMKKIEKRA